jgi:methionyl-tRNA synthetase
MNKFYITTPIYYVNDKPHLGHAYTTLCADVLARWHKLKGNRVFFLTGTDEHGAKVQQSAEAAGLTPHVFAEQNRGHFIQAWKRLDIEYDFFIRTSDPHHEAWVQKLLQKIYDAGYIYQGEYEGLYCVGCERYYKPDELVSGRCPLHPNREIEHQKEKNYFFKLSAFRDKLLAAIEAGEYHIVPEGRRNEVVGKLKQGLEDLSISREEVTWGVRVPWDETQTIYVWIDALINYYSATQFVEGKADFWPAEVHLLAKDILWFHAVIWEAMLMAADLPLPKVIATHGFFTIEGQKMSKSLGNAIDPLALVDEFGVEATRYLLLSQIPFTSDGDISLARFRDRYASDLANGLGNTFSRVTNMTAQYCDGKVPKGVVPIDLSAELSAFSFDAALEKISAALRSIDQEIDQTKPWRMVKEGKPVVELLAGWVQRLRGVAEALAPFMPETAQTLAQALSADTITKATPLFPRLTNS